jgi:hypothetical protein
MGVLNQTIRDGIYEILEKDLHGREHLIRRIRQIPNLKERIQKRQEKDLLNPL